MTLGVCYYPEHWPEDRWETDARLMLEAGLELVRIAEFAWAIMEPAEGRYDWGWLDRAIDVLAGAGLEIIMGTPTAAPPAWLSRRYPDTLPVDPQGHAMPFGMRRHYCPNSRVYRQLSRRIVAAMAERYGSRAEVIGWQIDNEWGGGKTPRCYCERCARAFRAWLRRRYQSLEALNEAWGTVFWSQVYDGWDQIGPPPPVFGKMNPSQALDYYRFMSDSWVAYQQLQVDVLRELTREGQFVTTNLMGLYPDLDYYDLGAPLDFVTWDSYPTGHTEFQRDGLYQAGAPGHREPVHAFDTGDPAIVGMAHDLTRSLKHKPFWVMEQQAGYINWGHTNPTPTPGVVRLWTWDAIAHGADAVLYFRWRACLLAQEQLHSGLLRHDGAPAQGLRDVESMRSERGLMAEIEGTQVDAQVAILHSYDDLWALGMQPVNRDFGYLRHLFTYYRALQRAGVPVDLAPPARSLERYKLVIAPTLYLADESVAANLRRYVEGGGHLLLSIRSGFKTASNRVVDKPLPGLLAYLVGAHVESWHSLPKDTLATLELLVPDGGSFAIPTWAEVLSLEQAQPLGRFVGDLLAGQVGASLNRVGAGEVIYLGAWATEALLEGLLNWLLPRSGVAPLASVSPGMKAMRRRGDDQEFLFLLNFSSTPGTATLPALGYVDALGGQPLAQEVTVPARGLVIARRPL